MWRSFTAFSVSARWTGAEEILEQVHTKSIVQTGFPFYTSFFVFLALFSFPPKWTSAFVIANKVSTTASISAGTGGAVVDICLTVLPNIPIPAFTLILVVKIMAF